MPHSLPQAHAPHTLSSLSGVSVQRRGTQAGSPRARSRTQRRSFSEGGEGGIYHWLGGQR